MKNSHGFSMIEIIVTLVIISVLAVIAVPSFKNVMIQEQLNQSATDLITTLQKAQSRALLEKQVMQVYVGTSPTLTDTSLSWMPSGGSTIKGGAVQIFIGKDGYVQTTATTTTFAGVKTFILCSQGETHSRKITFNRIGVITDSGLRENCDAS